MEGCECWQPTPSSETMGQISTSADHSCLKIWTAYLLACTSGDGITRRRLHNTLLFKKLALCKANNEAPGTSPKESEGERTVASYIHRVLGFRNEACSAVQALYCSQVEAFAKSRHSHSTGCCAGKGPLRFNSSWCKPHRAIGKTHQRPNRSLGTSRILSV